MIDGTTADGSTYARTACTADGSSIIDPAAICAATCFGGCGINPGLAATAIGDHLVTMMAAHLATAMHDLRLAAATAALIPCWQWQPKLSLALLAVELRSLRSCLVHLFVSRRTARLAGEAVELLVSLVRPKNCSSRWCGCLWSCS